MSITINVSGKEIINLDNPDKLKEYKSCNEKLTSECYGLAHKKFFRYGVCKNCVNYKQLINKREKDGKLFLINNNMEQYQILKLFKSLNSSQLLKISGLLTLEQRQELGLETQKNNKSNSEQKTESNEELNDSGEDLDNTSDDDLKISPNNEPNCSSNNDQKYQSKENSLKLKPTLKLVTSH
jgi:hypothetical protein